MKVTLPKEGFIIKEGVIAGERVFLVTPEQMGTVWNSENTIFRSSVWDANGEPVSLGLKKFVNMGEKPEVFPDPIDITNAQLIEKLDGSCLVVSKYKGELIVRTRGTFDATKLETGGEIAVLKQKYPKAFDNDSINDGLCSLIFEWTGAQRIVINYGNEPDMILTGCIRHADYRYASQSHLDVLAISLGLKRPKTYWFDTLETAINTIRETKGVEGVCLYFNNGQDIKKIKSTEYLMLHSVRSNLSTKNLAEMFFVWGEPTQEEFCKRFEATYDYESLKYAQDAITTLFKGVEKYMVALEFLRAKCRIMAGVPRKDYAIAMKEIFGASKEFAILMNLYTSKKTDTKILTELLLEHTERINLGMFGPKG